MTCFWLLRQAAPVAFSFAFDSAGKVTRIEEAGRRFAAEVGLPIEIGATPDERPQAPVDLRAWSLARQDRQDLQTLLEREAA